MAHGVPKTVIQALIVGGHRRLKDFLGLGAESRDLTFLVLGTSLVGDEAVLTALIDGDAVLEANTEVALK